MKAALPLSPVIVPPEPGDPARRAALATAMSAPGFVADLLLRLGITGEAEARAFFLAPMEECFAASRMLDMDRAVELLLHARDRREKVVVHGDYDVDGVTGTALLYLGLKWCGFDVDWFLPHRFRDGYGIGAAGVRALSERGFRWLVSVDTGISAVDEIALAAQLGLQVIVTDHHQAGSVLPPARAILNPNRPGCPYPNKGLAGAGVAYKLLNEIALRVHGVPATTFLDLAALGLLADNAPLVGENRSLVKAGIRLLSVTPRTGIGALLKQSGLESGGFGTGELLFRVVPLLNAAGRMGSAELAMRLLIEEDPAAAAGMAADLARENRRRRKLDQTMTGQACRAVEQSPALASSPCLVLSSPEWHEGVIGIVAARLVERFLRPAFVLAIDDKGTAKGSGRTVEGFNLHKALSETSDLLDKWGGHYYACGFSLPSGNIAPLAERLVEMARRHLEGPARPKAVSTASRLRLDEIDRDSMTWLRRFEPFGPMNELPLFYAEDVEILDGPTLVGETHLKLCLGNPSRCFDAIGFGLGHMAAELAGRSRLARIAFHPEWNSFRGVRRIQLRLAAVE